MKKLSIYLSFACILTFVSCSSVVEGVNDNPNDLTTDEIDAGLYMNTPEINSILIHCGDPSRRAAMWSGQLVGVSQLYLTDYLYQVTASSFDFDGYQSVITQTQYIREAAPDNKLYQGMCRVMEAYLFGSYASLFGDVPCSEVATGESYPAFDAQEDVFAYCQTILDEAITNLEAETAPSYRQDYIFSGSPTKWCESAYTLKARFYMLTKEYDKAYAAALKGVSDSSNSMLFVPLTDAVTTNKNRLWYVNNLNESLTTDGSYLMTLLASRENSKTDETARIAYYTIHTVANTNTGIAASTEPQRMITYEENLLTLAEAALRSQSDGFTLALSALNTLRAYLAAGGCVNSNFLTSSYAYDSYEASDFEAGGIENSDGSLTATRALLREIIEERYISGFTTYMPFDDARRLRGTSESDVAVSIPFNTATATQHIERFLYPNDEITGNINAPVDPGLYSPTPVNAN
ncbi:MAG: SusD/RagB family nutrient-binding outer rane lipoprotein [Bacteroidetes bacterium]|nr:SusD/RagB family nutrient-binding outer rane lipoprotein [Bacteroidota bacterium]